MNKRKAKNLLFSVQKSYFKAIKCFERAEYFSRGGQTTKALDKRDEGMVNIRKAEDAYRDLEAIIDAA